MRLFNWLKLLFQKPVVVIQRKKHPLWYNVALKERGVTEIRGNKHNDRILEYHQASNLKATTDEIAWCSSFVNWCLTQAGFFHLHSAAARSYLKWGAECKPYTGCVVVLKRGNSSWQGHVGFFVKQDKTHVWMLGGNQGNKVCIKPYLRSDVLGYRTPNQENMALDYHKYLS